VAVAALVSSLTLEAPHLPKRTYGTSSQLVEPALQAALREADSLGLELKVLADTPNPTANPTPAPDQVRAARPAPREGQERSREEQEGQGRLARHRQRRPKQIERRGKPRILDLPLLQ